MSPLSTTRLLTVPRILLWGSVLILSAWLAVTSPLSPLALRRAETLLIAGRAVEAADLFERVAVFYPDPDVRVEAWMQAAMIWMVDRPDPHRARSCLLQVIESPHASDALRATAWERLASACGIRDNVLRVCDAEFDRRYGCQVSTREVKKTDDKGNVTTIKEEFRSGPGCSMSTGELSRLQFAFQSECLADRNPPDVSSREGAACDCSFGSCSFGYPHVSDEPAVRYFPEKADK